MAAAAACAAAGCVLDSLEWSIALMAQWWAWLGWKVTTAVHSEWRGGVWQSGGGEAVWPPHFTMRNTYKCNLNMFGCIGSFWIMLEHRLFS